MEQPERIELPHVALRAQLEETLARMQTLRDLSEEVVRFGERLEGLKATLITPTFSTGPHIKQEPTAQQPPSTESSYREQIRELVTAFPRLLSLLKKIQGQEVRDAEQLLSMQDGLVAQLLETHKQLLGTRQQAVRQGFGRTAAFDYRQPPDESTVYLSDPFN
jgi:hypothetical protein